MSNTRIDSALLRNMFLAGAKNLEARKDYINELNVFPVPDGDTGTNMTLTIMSAAKDVLELEEINMETLSKAISSGSLKGARGNSGVILSQLFRGFTRVVKKVDYIDSQVVSEAFMKAVESAYKAVIKPKEGTILTVAKGMADKAAELALVTDDLEEMMGKIIEHGDKVLASTPDMLPILKESGVVDSGGEGLMAVMKGAYDVLLGKEVDLSFDNVAEEKKETDEEDEYARLSYTVSYRIKPGGVLTMDAVKELRAYVDSLGHVINVEDKDSTVNVKVYTNDPGLVIQKGLSIGSVYDVVVVNKEISDSSSDSCETLVKQETEAPAGPKKKYGFVSVSIGEGINEIFSGLGVDQIIAGGQTMNPSTADITDAIDKINADNIFIFPNNKNIIMAANQAKSLVKDKNIIVIPSKTVPQGITAIINFIEDKTPEENEAVMTKEMSKVKTGQVTYAVRDTQIDGKEIKENDIMGIGDSGIVAVGKDIKDVTADMIKTLVDDDSAIVSIYYGADSDEDMANAVADVITAAYPSLDVEVNYGGQPVYYFLVSVEQ